MRVRGERRRTSRATSQPSISGIERSVKTTSNSLRRTRRARRVRRRRAARCGPRPRPSRPESRARPPRRQRRGRRACAPARAYSAAEARPRARAARASTYGRSTVKVVPRPGREVAEMWPRVSLDDAVRDEEPEPRPVHALRREEGLEHARANLVGHPRARVREEQAQARAASTATDVETAARGHRVDGVDDEVDEDLANSDALPCVSIEARPRYLRHLVAQAARARVVLPARARYLDGVAQKLATSSPPAPLAGELVRERAYAADGGGRVLCRREDDVEPAAELPAGGRAAQQLRAAEYRGERVVEVVRDARGELPERAQLVGLRGALALCPRSVTSRVMESTPVVRPSMTSGVVSVIDVARLAVAASAGAARPSAARPRACGGNAPGPRHARTPL